jgi:hypothetical protein
MIMSQHCRQNKTKGTDSAPRRPDAAAQRPYRHLPSSVFHLRFHFHLYFSL